MKTIFTLCLFFLGSNFLMSQIFGEKYTLEDYNNAFKRDSLKALNFRNLRLDEEINLKDKQIKDYKIREFRGKQLKEATEKAIQLYENNVKKINSYYEFQLVSIRNSRDSGINTLKEKEINDRKIIAKIEEDRKKEKIKKEKDIEDGKKNALNDKLQRETIKNSTEFKAWKTNYISRIQKGKILVNNAKNIRKKYVYKNIYGENIFSLNSFSTNDKSNYLKIIKEIGNLLNQISNDNNSTFESIYYSSLPESDLNKTSELYAISQFYNEAY